MSGRLKRRSRRDHGRRGRAIGAARRIRPSPVRCSSASRRRSLACCGGRSARRRRSTSRSTWSSCAFFIARAASSPGQICGSSSWARPPALRARSCGAPPRSRFLSPRGWRPARPRAAPEATAPQHQAVMRFYRILDRLNAANRIAFVFHYVEGVVGTGRRRRAGQHHGRDQAPAGTGAAHGPHGIRRDPLLRICPDSPSSGAVRRSARCADPQP